MVPVVSLARIARSIPALGWMLLIFMLSSQRGFLPPAGVSDDLLAVAAHLFLFGMLALLLIAALPHPGRLTARHAMLIIVGTTAYGISDEVHQSFVAGRDASGLDVIVDGVGASFATALWLRLTRLRGS